MYKAIILGVLPYGSKTWTTKRDVVRRLKLFHNSCLKGILEIIVAQHQTGQLSSVHTAKHFGMHESLEHLTISRRMRRMGHVARMESGRVPKWTLFGWLPQRGLVHGTNIRRRHRARKHLKFGFDECSWYRVARIREVGGDEVYWAGRRHREKSSKGRGKEEKKGC